jgi:hypothetical protein
MATADFTKSRRAGETVYERKVVLVGLSKPGDCWRLYRWLVRQTAEQPPVGSRLGAWERVIMYCCRSIIDA